MQNAALDLAAEQAMARRTVSDNLVNIARRTQTLLGRSLMSLSDMEQTERDPDTLENLFNLDHLTTRMRRNAQSLLVLAGAEQNRLWSAPLPIGDVVRAAFSEIENYARVELGDIGMASVQGALAPDIAHLLAELLENATTFSPPIEPVMVVGRSLRRRSPDRRSSTTASGCARTSSTQPTSPCAGTPTSTCRRARCSASR